MTTDALPPPPPSSLLRVLWAHLQALWEDLNDLGLAILTMCTVTGALCAAIGAYALALLPVVVALAGYGRGYVAGMRSREPLLYAQREAIEHYRALLAELEKNQ